VEYAICFQDDGARCSHKASGRRGFFETHGRVVRRDPPYGPGKRIQKIFAAMGVSAASQGVIGTPNGWMTMTSIGFTMVLRSSFTRNLLVVVRMTDAVFSEGCGIKRMKWRRIPHFAFRYVHVATEHVRSLTSAAYPRE
jgi:hypothetical protein